MKHETYTNLHLNKPSIKLIKNRIRIARITKGISQEYLSHCLNVSQATYSRIESGPAAIDLDRLFDIVGFLQLDISWLLSQEN